MKKTILIILLSIFSIVLSNQTFAQLGSAKKYQVVVEVILGTHADNVTCDFKVYNADGTIYATESVTEPSTAYMNFKSSISYNPGQYFIYTVHGVENVQNEMKWWIYYAEGTYNYGYRADKTLAWQYGIPPGYIQ